MTPWTESQRRVELCVSWFNPSPYIHHCFRRNPNFLKSIQTGQIDHPNKNEDNMQWRFGAKKKRHKKHNEHQRQKNQPNSLISKKQQMLKLMLATHYYEERNNDTWTAAFLNSVRFMSSPGKHKLHTLYNCPQVSAFWSCCLAGSRRRPLGASAAGT